MNPERRRWVPGFHFSINVCRRGRVGCNCIIFWNNTLKSSLHLPTFFQRISKKQNNSPEHDQRVQLSTSPSLSHWPQCRKQRTEAFFFHLWPMRELRKPPKWKGNVDTIFSRLNASSVYSKFDVLVPAFNRGPAFIDEVEFCGIFLKVDLLSSSG